MFLYPPSCVHRDRRPDLTVSSAPSPRFVFVFESFYLFLSFVCLSRGKEVAARHPALACVMTAWEFGGIAARPRALLPADRGRYPPPAVALPSPPAGCRSPRRAVRGRSRHRPASDSMPAGSPLTLARGSSPHVTPGVPFLSRVVVHRSVLISHVLSVHGDLSGAGGSSCCGRGGHSSRLPPCCGSGGGS